MKSGQEEEIFQSDTALETTQAYLHAEAQARAVTVQQLLYVSGEANKAGCICILRVVFTSPLDP